jgi:hypothetical protein
LTKIKPEQKYFIPVELLEWYNLSRNLETPINQPHHLDIHKSPGELIKNDIFTIDKQHQLLVLDKAKNHYAYICYCITDPHERFVAYKI